MALAAVDPDAAIEYLDFYVMLLTSDPWRVFDGSGIGSYSGRDPRVSVADAIGRLGAAASKAVPALEAATRSDSPELRDAARQALARIAAPPAAAGR